MRRESIQSRARSPDVSRAEGHPRMSGIIDELGPVELEGARWLSGNCVLEPRNHGSEFSLGEPSK